jgi:UDP-sugar pyrophosphorylase
MILAMGAYRAALERTRGQVEEFVNPKYADARRAAFKAPARLECLMQDIAWALPAGAPVGYVLYPPEYGYFPCKNDIGTAAALSARGVPPYAAATAEMATYNAHASLLRALGAAVARPVERTFHGVTVPLGAAIVLHPSFAPCATVLRSKLPKPGAISITGRSSLVVRGRAIVIESLQLDGALEIACAEGASLRIVSLAVTNEGWQFDELSPAVQGSPECPDILRMRGYTLRKRGQRRITVAAPGVYEVRESALLRLDTALSSAAAAGAAGGAGGGRARGGACDAPAGLSSHGANLAAAASAGGSAPGAPSSAEPSA